MKCPVCGGALTPCSYQGILHCNGCDFFTVDQTLSGEALGELYNYEYYHGTVYADYVQEKKNIQRNLVRRLSKLLSLTDHPERKRLYEIGCAYGFFLEMAEPKFAHVAGIDISKEPTAYARAQGFDASCGDFLSDAFSPAADVYCMWDTIEHLAEPARFVEKIASLTKPGALLALTTGDIGSLNARMRGPHWRQIMPPYHLHFFSEKSMRTLLERHGFEVTYLGHPGQWLGVDAILRTIFLVRMKKQGVYNGTRWISKVVPHLYVNLLDLMFVCAVRR